MLGSPTLLRPSMVNLITTEIPKHFTRQENQHVLTSGNLSVELDEVLDVVLMLVADGAQLGVLHQVRVVLLAVGVGAVDAEPDSSLAALHAVVPRAEPLFSAADHYCIIVR